MRTKCRHGYWLRLDVILKWRLIKMRHLNKITIAIACLSGISPSFAGINPALLHGHIVLQVGAYQSKQGYSQHINIVSLIGDNFTVADSHDSNGLLGLGYYVDGSRIKTADMRYGINAFYLAPTSVNGKVIQENLFSNLSYHYNVNHVPVYAMAKAAFHVISPRYAITVDGGIGPNFMNVYNFHENSLDNGVTIPDNAFSSKSTVNFSATIGLGLKAEHAFGDMAAECGYRFFYLGQGNLKKANSQILNSLKTGSVYANAIQCSVST